MAGNKSPRKKMRQVVYPGADYIAQDFTFSKEKSYTISLKLLARLENFRDNVATLGDRISLMIRIHAGVKRLEDFEHDGAVELFAEALDILRECREKTMVGGKKTQIIKKLTRYQIDVIAQALSVVVELFIHSTLWEEALAIKYGEDQMLMNAEDWTYHLVQTH